jgi:uncharacterized protein (TIGR03118 family)
MKNLTNIKILIAGILTITCFYACKKDISSGSKTPGTNNNITSDFFTANFAGAQVNLVSDTAGFNASLIDSNLVNAWGMATPPGGPIWISANGKGVSTIYDRTTGQTLKAPVTIPAAMTGQTGAPTGVIFNSTPFFGGYKFIFAGEDGIIAGWKSGGAAVKVADRSQFNAVYKGLTMATDGGGNTWFLYVANFRGGKIDVFDMNFNYVTTKPFSDPTIPAGYGPFNIQKIGDNLYVTYAKQKAPIDMDDQPGLGNGYVDVFKTNGTLVKRFFSRGDLNSPWGMTLAPAGFADAQQTILIGNFGDGKINVFDLTGNHLGELQSGAHALVIDGLWGIDFFNGNVLGKGTATQWLYFSAGPDDESHGLFGYLHK